MGDYRSSAVRVGKAFPRLKIKRLIYLVNGVTLRLLSLTTRKDKTITKKSKEEPPGVDLPTSKKSERIVTTEILFSLWAATLFLGWFLILKWTPKGPALDALFDVTSAMSNVGLTSGDSSHQSLPSLENGFLFS